MCKAVVAFALLVSPAWAQNAPLSEGPITCSSPVTPGDSAKSLMQRYVRRLWFRLICTPRWRTLLTRDLSSCRKLGLAHRGFVHGRDDEPCGRPHLAPHGEDESLERRRRDHWLKFGRGEKINGKPLLVNGFDSDFAGFVVNWKGGTLARPLPGGCRVRVRFGKDDDRSASGDRISSDNAELVKWGSGRHTDRSQFPQ
jgi:hypothetical protein